MEQQDAYIAYIREKITEDLNWLKKQLVEQFNWHLSETSFTQLRDRIDSSPDRAIIEKKNATALDKTDPGHCCIETTGELWLYFRCTVFNTEHSEHMVFSFLLRVQQNSYGICYAREWSIVGEALRLLTAAYAADWSAASPYEALQSAGVTVLQNALPHNGLVRGKNREWALVIGISKYGQQNPNLFFDLSTLSHMTYERAAATASFVFVSYQNAFSKRDAFAVLLQTPVSIKNYRLARKLVEISSRDLYMVCTQSHILGFAEERALQKFHSNHGLDAEVDTRCLTVELSRSKWTVKMLYLESPMHLFVYQNGLFRHTDREEPDYLGEIKSAFPGCNIPVLVRVILAARSQSHGTMLVISDRAQREAVALAHCCIPIKPAILEMDVAACVTAIDGAVLCDPQGICYAIGVILDGVHGKDSGESIDRGARHNSARRYAHWTDTTCLIVIVSEDGDVSIVKSKNLQ